MKRKFMLVIVLVISLVASSSAFAQTDITDLVLLLNWGFHKTAGYGCGQDPFVTCENGYTRGRSYTGPYGTCSSPRFRDQGIATSA